MTTWMRVAISLMVGAAGLFGTYFISKFVREWGNEIENVADDREITQGREEADESDQDLNEQTSKLPRQ